jgi:hypothetical protein
VLESDIVPELREDVGPRRGVRVVAVEQSAVNVQEDAADVTRP